MLCLLKFKFCAIVILMFKKFFPIVIVLLFGLLLSGCSLKKAPAALQISSTPEANVFIDGKQMGKTPFSNDNLTAGEVTVKLIPETTTESLSSWEGKVKLNPGVLTLIERTFSSLETNSSTLILTLEKIKDKTLALISVISEPDGAYVSIDGENKGVTPLDLDKINAGDHEVVIFKEGYLEKIKPVKNIAGYKLIINAKLGLAQEEVTVTPTPTTATSKVTPKPTGTTKISPTPGSGIKATSVLIGETETGFLRVRSGPSSSYTEISRVNPGEKYPFLEEKSGWYKITYEEGKEGWVSARYATLE